MLHGRQHQGFARRLRGVRHVGGDLRLDILRAQRFVLPQQRLHGDQIDRAGIARFRAHGQLDDQRRRPQTLLDHRHAAVEVGTDAIHLVDEAHPGDSVSVRLAPHRLGLRLDARHAVEDADRAIEHPQRALHLDGEIHMSRRVDDVDAVVAPEAGRRGGGDGDAALLLLVHPVHRGGAVMHLAHAVRAPGIEQDPLRGRRLAGVDMRHDADIAIPPERRGARHRSRIPAPEPPPYQR